MKLIFTDGREGGMNLPVDLSTLLNTHTQNTATKNIQQIWTQRTAKESQTMVARSQLDFYFLCIRGIWQVEVCEGAQARSEGMLLIMLKSDHFWTRNYSSSWISTSHSHWNMTHHTTQPWNEIGSDPSQKKKKNL